MNPLVLQPLNAQVCRVLTAQGLHLGNLKRIGGAWKFKAIGYERNGDVIPGGGPLTDRHNAVFDALDEATVSQALLGQA